jgi:hypothetical protein
MLGSLIQQLRVDLAAFRASSKMAGVGTLSANRLRPSRRQLESKPEASKEAPTAAIATKLCRLGAKSGAVFLYLATLSRTRSVPGSSSYVTTPRTNQATKSPPTIITVLNHRLIAMRRESCLRRCRSIAYIRRPAASINGRRTEASPHPRPRRGAVVADVPRMILSSLTAGPLLASCASGDQTAATVSARMADMPYWMRGPLRSAAAAKSKQPTSESNIRLISRRNGNDSP